MGVLALWRYPVKAMLGELLESVELGPAGCAGDRRWIVIDLATGERIASKRGPTDPRLRACRAELLTDDAELPLRVTLPDGTAVSGVEIETALSDLLERSVALAPADTPPAGKMGATGAHHDVAPLHLITTSTLERLRRAAPDSDWDPRRFRPNLVLDDGAPGPAFAEDLLVGGALRGDDGLEIAIEVPTPRCVVPTRTHDGLPADPRILRTVVAEHRLDLGAFGSRGCAGAYARVTRPGRLRAGQLLEAEFAPSDPGREIARAVSGLAARLQETLAQGDDVSFG